MSERVEWVRLPDGPVEFYPPGEIVVFQAWGDSENEMPALMLGDGSSIVVEAEPEEWVSFAERLLVAARALAGVTP